MCQEVKLPIDDWWSNLAGASEVASKITETRDRYRGQLSPEMQAAIDAAKGTVGAGGFEMNNPTSGIVTLANACNSAFGLGILTTS